MGVRVRCPGATRPACCAEGQGGRVWASVRGAAHQAEQASPSPNPNPTPKGYCRGGGEGDGGGGGEGEGGGGGEGEGGGGAAGGGDSRLPDGVEDHLAARSDPVAEVLEVLLTLQRAGWRAVRARYERPGYRIERRLWCGAWGGVERGALVRLRPSPSQLPAHNARARRRGQPPAAPPRSLQPTGGGRREAPGPQAP